uniref:(northern house mosquito) hypothetical protein n=1 Tax=Culex pipiens TaxID=7175 RepID=A0A8D8C134_CULPI
MRVVLLSLNAMEIHSFLFVLLEFVSARGQFIFTDFFFWQPDCVSLCVCFSVGFLLLLVASLFLQIFFSGNRTVLVCVSASVLGFCYCLLFSVCFAHIYKIYLNLLD